MAGLISLNVCKLNLQDLAQVIAERSSLMTALLPSTTNKTPQAARTLESLLKLFWHYLLKVRKHENILRLQFCIYN